MLFPNFHKYFFAPHQVPHKLSTTMKIWTRHSIFLLTNLLNSIQIWKLYFQTLSFAVPFTFKLFPFRSLFLLILDLFFAFMKHSFKYFWQLNCIWFTCFPFPHLKYCYSSLLFLFCSSALHLVVCKRIVEPFHSYLSTTFILFVNFITAYFLLQKLFLLPPQSPSDPFSIFYFAVSPSLCSFFQLCPHW